MLIAMGGTAAVLALVPELLSTSALLASGSPTSDAADATGAASPPMNGVGGTCTKMHRVCHK